MRAYLLNKAVLFKSVCRFSAKKLPLPPGRCWKDFFILKFVIVYYLFQVKIRELCGNQFK